MVYSEIVRALPTRPDIKELQYSGARFSRGAIARFGQRLQSRYPTHKFQILLPYENWKPGGWTSGNQPASLFSLLDHYDEAQLPDDADPDYFERFIIYVRDAPPVAGGCNGELNDCLYECLKYIYGTFSKMPKSIEKPEYIKKALGLNCDAPVPVSYMDKVEQLAGSLALNIVGDSTRISKSKSDRRATLILSEGHYSLALNPGRLHPIKSLTVGQFQKGKNSDSYSFIPIEKNCKTGIYETFEETYQRIHEERDSFLQATKKFGLGIDLSYHNCVGVPANDPLDPVEAEWISDAIMGGLIWADNEWKGYGRQYDVTSLYPNHRGYALYGLFRASSQGAPKGKVSGNDILFRQNKRGVYTFIDLQRAKKLGLDIQLIQDGKPNALIYDREARIPGTFTNPGSPFKGEYPRIAPFLLAHGRKMTSELLEPYKDKVRRIHTDGFILEEQPSSPTLITCPENASKALKALKFEIAGYCHVKNANKVIWT
ncbi:hypothetical protein GLOIN_2v1472929 [Rhizophagus irregularis DAOM 181602=DAOM 197198]|nr:hypothetical protein GLOIN_2v1472929 [Rhizophagus irregularis DAOM 181602=DAOM 197198]